MKFVTVVFVTMLPFLKASQKDWVPIFVAFSGNGKSVGQAWISGKGTGSIQADLKNANRSHHLRSPLIDSWSKHNILQIRIELHRSDCMVAWMIFDGRGSTAENWFDRDRLLSSFDNKEEVKEFPYFKLRPELDYPFAIARIVRNCEEVSGVFGVLEKNYYCTWGKYDRYPLIMYTKNDGTPRNLHTGAQKADLMFVHVRI